MIFFEALEKAFESSPRIFEALANRSNEITEGVNNLTATVDRLHGTSDVLAGQVIHFAQEPGPVPHNPHETTVNYSVDKGSYEAQQTSEAQKISEAQSKVDQVFAEIYQENPDLSKFDDELMAA